MKTQTTFQKREYLKKVSAYINFALSLLGDDITPGKRFLISKFKVEYQLAQLMDFSNEHAIDNLVLIGDSIIKQ